MRLPAPTVPAAATAAFGAAFGPRVLPGSYTINVTKDRNVFTSKLELTQDPRATHSMDDRRAQFALAEKLHAQLGDMTRAVERINAVRLALDDRATKLGSDALAKKLRTASASVDEIRKRVVATKEGGMITGEERLREYLADLYGTINGYEGRPSAAQMERTDALARELGDVVKDFDAWSAKELPAINTALKKKGLDPIA
jgi:hypothetical protein